MDNQQHHLPHIHAEYQGMKAVLTIPGGELLEGELPGKKLRLLQAWIDIHEEELMPVFKRLQNPAFFSLARVDYGTVIWPGDIDIEPETLYDRSIPLP